MLREKFLPLLVGIGLFGSILVGGFVYHVSGNKLSSSQESGQTQKKLIELFHKLSLKTTSGKTIDLSKQNRPVIILNFWASWCRPCIQEFPSLVELQKRYPQEVLVIGINSDQESPEQKIKSMVERYNLNFPQVLDKDQSLMVRFDVDRLPLSITYGSGKVIDIHNRRRNFVSQEFLSKIKKHFKKTTSSAALESDQWETPFLKKPLRLPPQHLPRHFGQL